MTGPRLENELHLLLFPLLVSSAELDAVNLRIICRVFIIIEVLCDGKTGCTLSDAPKMFAIAFPKSVPGI